jgi:hypothetical protein
MKPVLIAGISIVNFALISYLIATVKLFNQKKITRSALFFLSIGVIFDLTATICMILGSSKGLVTLHGIIGYSSLSGMIIDTVLCFRKVISNRIGIEISNKFRNLSLTFFLYWIAAYITGSILVILKF